MKVIYSILAILATTIHDASAEPSPGCGKAPASLKNGLNIVNVKGVSRQFILRLPDTYDNMKPYRLIFAFHATGGSANSTSQRYDGLLAPAGSTSILVAPQGQTPSSGGGKATGFAALVGAFAGGITGWWKTGGKYGTDDLDFVDKLIETIDSDLCIDTRLRFSTGFSFGGVISYSLACLRGEKFRAVSVRSGGNFDAILGSMGGKGDKTKANGPGACKKTDSLTSTYAGIDASKLIEPLLLGNKKPAAPLVCGNTPIAYMGSMGICDGWIEYGRLARDDFLKNNGCEAKAAQIPVEGSGRRSQTKYECKTGTPVVWSEFDGAHAPQRIDEEDTWKFFSQFT
jgi:poly(3-hydroxybutyrate) depolymerase